ncbi:unnamed protein product [Closterium sp. Yama58-4]|nr:unnamed protein product [Closterium sp. Yama58-4]
MLTKGTQKETGGNFTATPVTLFVYEAGQAVSGCGVQLAFQVNFTFSLSPRSGRVGNSGFAFVVSATDRVGNGTGVGYAGMDNRSLAIELDTFQDKQYGDMSSHYVGLNVRGQETSLAAVKSPFVLNNKKAYSAWVDYEPGEPGTIQVFLAASEVKPEEPLLERRVALCEVLQAGAEQNAFFFGFVASTVKPFQMHLILTSAMTTDASWAYAVVASVEAAYGIAMNQEAPRLSVDSLFAAMGLTSPAAKCTTGNSPAAAFEKLLTLPRGGLSTDSKPPSTYPIQGFERTRFKGYVGLMLAVRRQPVVVHIEASASTFIQYDGTFKYQDPSCYTGNLNHAVLVVGYLISTKDGRKSPSAPPFWIIRNSWGPKWGDRGHMRMDIQGGDGVCGINVLPGIYPIVKIDMCGSYAMNPCAAGTCINDGKGSYSCICPPNYIESRTVDNFSTCDPGAATLHRSWLNRIMNFDGLLAVNCTQPLPLGKVIQLGSTVTTIPCTSFFYALDGDTCASISTQLELTPTELAALNPGLNCSEPIKAGRSLCIERNATLAYTIPQCLQYSMLTAQDTCEGLMLQSMQQSGEDGSTGAEVVTAASWAELYRNNPGLICPRSNPASSATVATMNSVQVCLKADYESLGSQSCRIGRLKVVSPALSCAGALSFYGGAKPGAVAKFSDYNGRTCLGTVGVNYLCVP